MVTYGSNEGTVTMYDLHRCLTPMHGNKVRFA